MYGKKRISLTNDGKVLRVGGRSRIHLGFWWRMEDGSVLAEIHSAASGKKLKEYTGKPGAVRKAIAAEYLDA